MWSRRLIGFIEFVDTNKQRNDESTRPPLRAQRRSALQSTLKCWFSEPLHPILPNKTRILVEKSLTYLLESRFYPIMKGWKEDEGNTERSSKIEMYDDLNSTFTASNQLPDTPDLQLPHSLRHLLCSLSPPPTVRYVDQEGGSTPSPLPHSPPSTPTASAPSNRPLHNQHPHC